MTPAIIVTIISIIIVLACFVFITVIANRKGNPNVPKTAQNKRIEKAVKRRQITTLTVVLIFFAVIAACKWSTAKEDFTSWTSSRDSKQEATGASVSDNSINENPDGDSPEEAQTPANEAEDTGEDAGETASAGNWFTRWLWPAKDDATEPAPAEGAEGENPEGTDAGTGETDGQAVEYAATSAVTQVGAGLSAMAEIINAQKSASQEPGSNPESGTLSAAENVQEWLTYSSASWSAFNLALKESVKDTIVKIDSDTIRLILSSYYLDVPLHLDWEEADWLKKRIADEGKGAAYDLMGFPMYGGIDSWLWFDQAIGCRQVTAEDLKGVDLTDHDAVWAITKPKLEAWEKEFNELSSAEQQSRIDELVLYALNNMSGYDDMAAQAFRSEEWLYWSAKSIFDDIQYWYDTAYDIAGKDVNDRNTAVGRECFMEFPDDVEFFNPDKHEYNAVYKEEFRYDVMGQLSMIYIENFAASDIKTYTTDMHWCYPNGVEARLRRATLAPYTEKGIFMRKTYYGKHGVNVRDLLVNLDDGRFGFQTATKTTTPKTNQQPTNYDLDIDYVFEDGSQAKPHYHAQLKFGDAYRVVSPTIDGYTCDTPVVEGVMPARNMYYKVIYRKIQQNNTDNSSSNNTTNNENHEDDKKEDDGGDDKKEEFSKDAGQEATREEGGGNTGGGGTTGNEDGADTAEQAKKDQQDDWEAEQQKRAEAEAAAAAEAAKKAEADAAAKAEAERKAAEAQKALEASKNLNNEAQETEVVVQEVKKEPNGDVIIIESKDNPADKVVNGEFQIGE